MILKILKQQKTLLTQEELPIKLLLSDFLNYCEENNISFYHKSNEEKINLYLLHVLKQIDQKQSPSPIQLSAW